MDRPGVERPGVERPGVERPGVERPGVERPGVERTGIAKKRYAERRKGTQYHCWALGYDRRLSASRGLAANLTRRQPVRHRCPFTLPLQRAAPALTDWAERRCMILVADDHADTREALV